jgi:tRNA-splicing ligase RtcB
VPRAEKAPYRIWGSDLEPESIRQIENACSLPVSVRGALMPDAHVGYGLPIGGVLATRGAVIPYAVGVDIACRMKMTVLDLPVDWIESREDVLRGALEAETRFGVGASFRRRREHEVLDADWSVTAVTREQKDRAWSQLGTSGSGNHFVEFGIFSPGEGSLGLAPGKYLAVLSHSGSRGTGASVADHYSKLARSLRPELPEALRHLAWLDLDAQEGQEYWAAMELMGRYAAANHACIHRHLVESLGARALLDLENHHNFAWKEEHDGEELIVHRKGATPAGEGVIGIIPGSMASTTYVVRGKGSAAALDSASHGAGRRMSRTKALATFSWKEVAPYLAARQVKLISAGLDEVPMVYKDIEEVMAAQGDLVEPIATFLPRLVKMAPAGERPED